jgi:hypothetical protein
VRQGWNRHRSSVDANGDSCGYYSDEAVSFCMIGSIYRVIISAMGGDRKLAHTPAFRETANRLTRYLALAMPDIIPLDVALSRNADDPHYGIEARLAEWNDGVACQRCVVAALEAAADLADHDAQARPGCRLADYAVLYGVRRPDLGKSILSLSALEYGVKPIACWDGAATLGFCVDVPKKALDRSVGISQKTSEPACQPTGKKELAHA